jgi:UDPglucose--hexose-1-phosphate uridylyltransferase
VSELRRDPILERWVIVAPERGERAFESGRPPAGGASPPACPDCPGHEAATPPELCARRDAASPANGPGWRVRVVPNRYPALSPQSPDTADLSGHAGFGRHEVIVEAPAHVASLTALGDGALVEVLEVWSERLRAAASDPALHTAMLFQNTGAGAGASRRHVHSQLIALPVIPGAMRAEQALSRRHLEAIGVCAWCALRRDEARDQRVVLEDDGVTLFCPYASRMPFEIWLLPNRHAARFEDARQRELAGIARALRRTLLALEATVGATPYNLVLRTAPLQAGPLPAYHWRLEIVPRATTPGGFEWGSGVYINPLPPEEAAARLRAALA